MRVLLLSTCALLAGCFAANAATVTFTGTVSAICSILASTNGTLGLSTNGDEVSSLGTLGGASGSATILSIGSNHILVDAPTRTAAPGGYVAAGEAVEVKLLGVSGLSAVDVDWTDVDVDIPVGTIAASALTVHNRITNPGGFAAGNYATQTIVTCTP